jgi:hypothetical protein
MTRKNYVAVAEALSAELRAGGDSSTLKNVAVALCGVFKQDNPNFSEKVFMKEVGFGGAVLGAGSSSGGNLGKSLGGTLGRGSSLPPTDKRGYSTPMP